MSWLNIFKIKFTLVVIVGLFLTGCSPSPLHPTGCHKTYATGSCSSGRWDDQDEWGEKAREIRDALNANLTSPERWKRKECRLHIHFAEDGTVIKAYTTSGNKEYCEALLTAVSKTKFSKFMNPVIYHDFRRLHLSMQG
ncbi:cell envelope integrity TolA C-terminal domain-containing protein [Erwinia sp. S38]|uniref:cell envelope integrity TolA C-terminal domain-containing protein n=1 Tax=Erwinia sp. S38 TaxID=2769338 RepID=UPI001909B8CF|nr:cell envelope integrity TolA C-terminal domain-containing protein [Erwinia sp. S38]MBK0004827.1 tolA family protein [Erwinia sp. S38]